MMTDILFLMLLPLALGLFLAGLGNERAAKNLSGAALLLSLAWSVVVFMQQTKVFSFNLCDGYTVAFGLNRLSKFILIFVNFFGLLVGLYSREYSSLKKERMYYPYLLWLIAFSNAAVCSADFLLFVFSWGATLVLLYAMLRLGSAQGAGKALSVVGFGDFSLILGIGIYVFLNGSTILPEGEGIALANPLAWSSFLLMLMGAFAKSGCAPLHTWIPTAAESAPIPVMAILPASLDKLLGIYLLARICLDFFVLSEAALGLLLIMGSITIVFAVMMALIQHDLRKLLSYHAISQVGYMVIGFGTGTPIGIVGGLFHMVNNALYKTGLFMTGGAAGEKRNTFDLEKLGGLATYMPVSFACGLIFALSISGIPPFNGFASKWMLYQGVLTGMFRTASAPLKALYAATLIAAMFGSALTLASFVKFIHAIFLGQDMSETKKKVSEAPRSMLLAVAALAAFCLILGIVPNAFLNALIGPRLMSRMSFLGTYNSVLAFLLLVAGLLAGVIFWLSLRGKKIKPDSMFIGGEEPVFNPSFPGTEFYRSVEGIALVKRLYAVIKFEALDAFQLIRVFAKAAAYVLFACVDRLINVLTCGAGYLVLGLSWFFRVLHSGVLDLYLAWSLAGLVVLFSLLMLR